MESKSPVIEKLARALLATTCLTGVAGASTITVVEGQGIASGGFGQTFDTAFLLPIGTSVVIGSVGGPGGNNWVEFQGLPTTDGNWDIQTTVSGGSEASLTFYDSLGNYVGVTNIGEEAGPWASFDPVPGDGKLAVDIAYYDGGAMNYTMDLDAPPVSTSGAPEPATLPATGAGLALAGALAWRRRRKAEA